MKEFTNVRATADEVADYLRKHPGRRYPAVWRAQCNLCGARIWKSGLGVGAHRKSCPRTRVI